MQKTIKGIAVAAMIICIALFGVNTAFYYYLPSNYSVSSIDEFDNISVFGVTLKNSSNDEAVAANNSAGNISPNKGTLMLGNIIPIKNVDINFKEDRKVIPGGSAFGIKLFTQGVMVVKMDSIKTENKTFTPAKEAGVEIGDMILKVDNCEINSNEDLINAVEKSKGNDIDLLISRNGEEINTTLRPINTNNGNDYKIGIWVRDSSAGIGTVTFYDPESHGFAGLGHGICDVDTGEILPLSEGEIVRAEIDGVTAAQKGKAGTLNGHHDGSAPTGYVISNTETGVYGHLNGSPTNFEPVSVAFKQEVQTGYAQIITTLDNNTPDYYDIEIESINYDDSGITKNLVIKITDSKLLEKTNGIVQGMSGSPIIQNGKLVGAVTHVFVNEPQKGYGIFAENMLLDFDKENQIKEEPAA